MLSTKQVKHIVFRQRGHEQPITKSDIIGEGNNSRGAEEEDSLDILVRRAMKLIFSPFRQNHRENKLLTWETFQLKLFQGISPFSLIILHYFIFIFNIWTSF